MKNKVKALEYKVRELKNLISDSSDNSEGFIQEIQKLTGIIRRMKKQKYNIPNTSNIVTETVLPKKDYSVPNNFNWYGSHPLVTPLVEFQINKGYKYVLTCHMNNDALGKQDMLFLSSRSSNLTDYIGDTRVLLTPNSNDKSLVEFVGNQEDNSEDNKIKMTFKGMANSEAYILPLNQSNVYGLELKSYHYPYNDPDYPNDAEIIVPDPTDSDPNNKNNQNVIDLLNKLLQQLENHQIDIPNVYSSEDENGNVNYSFTADLVQPKWSFVQAVNQLNYHNGMRRVNATRDYWVELNSTDNLCIVYKGNDKIFPFSPSKKDIDGKWIVENVRPFMPNNKPINNKGHDDSTDTNNFGYSVNDDPFVDNESNGVGTDSGDWSNTDEK